MGPSMLKHLQARRSSPRVAAPAPAHDELSALFAAALSAPDHGALRPTRFLVLHGDGLERFADHCVAELLQREPEATSVQQQTIRRKAMRAPMIIVAISSPVEHAKVPRIEQLASTATAVMLLQLGIDALGYGSVWRTGAWAYSAAIKAVLGVADHEEIMAFLYVGTPQVEPTPRQPININDHWQLY